MIETFEGNIKTVETLIDDEFFLCTRMKDEEGKIEYGFQIKQGIDKTVEKLVELYNIEAKLEVIKQCIE